MKKLFIQIPEPCHEDWSKMTKVEQGRYCDSCCKEVVDFTVMTDQQILNYLSTPRGKTCGNFLPDQLNRAISAPQQPSKKWGWGVMFSFLVTLAGACKQRTAGKMSIVSEEKKENSGYVAENVTLGEMIATEEARNEFVTVENVSIKGDMVQYPVVDTVFAEEITPPVEEMKELPCGLDIDSITTTEEQYQLMGFAGGLSFVSVEDVRPVEQTIIDTIKNIFITPEIKLYPNPASRSSRVNVKINTPSDYQVMLSDNQSRIVYQSSFNISQKNQVFLMDLPSSIAAGMYYVIVTDKKSKKRFTEKLIIQ